jgi:hypothetical protein
MNLGALQPRRGAWPVWNQTSSSVASRPCFSLNMARSCRRGTHRPRKPGFCKLDCAVVPKRKGWQGTSLKTASVSSSSSGADSFPLSPVVPFLSAAPKVGSNAAASLGSPPSSFAFLWLTSSPASSALRASFGMVLVSTSIDIPFHFGNRYRFPFHSGIWRELEDRDRPEGDADSGEGDGRAAGQFGG